MGVWEGGGGRDTLTIAELSTDSAKRAFPVNAIDKTEVTNSRKLATTIIITIANRIWSN